MSKSNSEFPATLHGAIKYFPNDDHAFNFMRSIRWPDGVIKCPRCGSTEVFFLSTRKIWKCKAKHEKQQFSVKIGTVLEDSPIALDKWLCAFWLIANAKNGISSYELSRSIGVTQKTAWFVLHRIRLAMQDGSIEKFSGKVEADETFIGGKARNMHADKKAKKILHRGRGHVGKVAVMGLTRAQFARTSVPRQTAHRQKRSPLSFAQAYQERSRRRLRSFYGCASVIHWTGAGIRSQGD